MGATAYPAHETCPAHPGAQLEQSPSRWLVLVKGGPDTAADRVQPVEDAVAGVQAAHPAVTIEEVGDASANKWFNDTLGG